MTQASLFVSGMLRSGTSLVQALLTNHREMLVAYQPFHRLYTDAKQWFLAESGIERSLPFNSGDPAYRAEIDEFQHWLRERRFSAVESRRLSSEATSGKGAGLPGWLPPATAPGTFFDIRAQLHQSMGIHLGRPQVPVLGSKEILCDEYLPSLLAQGTRCILVIRDPRGVVASANHGRYQAMVGDRYPLMMLVRLWRKTAAFWLEFRSHPLVHAIRYEDLALAPGRVLEEVTDWLGTDRFPVAFEGTPLLDHAGQPWHGNSSFGDKAGVDGASVESWRTRLGKGEQAFIAAATRPELAALGYSVDDAVEADDILGFRQEEGGVRQAYLAMHPLDAATRRHEAERFERYGRAGCKWDRGASDYFLFPGSVLAGAPPIPAAAVP